MNDIQIDNISNDKVAEIIRTQGSPLDLSRYNIKGTVLTIMAGAEPCPTKTILPAALQFVATAFVPGIRTIQRFQA
jgi:hypothetical protein